MTTPAKPHRDTLFLEQAAILEHRHFDGDQHILRLQAPSCATHARPGSFVHLTCDPRLPLRRPLSLMRTDAARGWVEILYKAVGQGTRLLRERKVGEQLSLLGPIGRPFEVTRRRPLLIGGGVGMPPMIFLAAQLREQAAGKKSQPLVILGSEVPFPFTVARSRQPVAGLGGELRGTMPLLEDWGIPARLASQAGLPGCHPGYVTDLARQYLEALTETERNEVEVLACGPHPMLEAVAALAREFGLPCQVSLEEFMACGVGGCAGCVVEVQTAEGPAMKRVCVDGPVFDAAGVFPG